MQPEHEHRWAYFGDMARCACGSELLPDGTVRDALGKPRQRQQMSATVAAKRAQALKTRKR